MQYKKGQSGNPNGRPKGSKNKRTSSLREKVQQLLDDNFDQLQNDLDTMLPHDRVKALTSLLQYGLPRLQAVALAPEVEDLTANYRALTDEQLDELINGLIKTTTNES